MTGRVHRLSALALLVALALGAALAVRASVVRLHAARVAARPGPSPSSLAVLRLPGSGTATMRLAALVRARAAEAGMVLDRVAPISSAAPLVSVEIGVSAQEPTLLRFVAALEKGSPPLRFTAARLSAPGEVGMPMRLEGRVVAWAPKP